MHTQDIQSWKKYSNLETHQFTPTFYHGCRNEHTVTPFPGANESWRRGYIFSHWQDALAVVEEGGGWEEGIGG